MISVGALGAVAGEDLIFDLKKKRDAGYSIATNL